MTFFGSLEKKGAFEGKSPQGFLSAQNPKKN